MEMRIDGNSHIPYKRNNNNSKVSEEETNGSNPKDPTTKVSLSKEVMLIQKASEELDELESIRQDAVEMAKEVLNNWTEPSDAEIDAIFNDMAQ